MELLLEEEELLSLVELLELDGTVSSPIELLAIELENDPSSPVELLGKVLLSSYLN